MQPLTAAPRDMFTAAQIKALLTADDLDVGYGVELLDPSLTLLEDLSADVSACTVTRDCLANVHGATTLSISRALAWGRDRVRPFMTLSSLTAAVTGARFNMGVYLLTTPDTSPGETPPTFQATGMDQLYLLQSYIGDSYAVPAGANVLGAVRAALTAAGVLAPVLLDTSAAAAVVPAGGKSWLLTSDGVTAAPGAKSAPFMWIDVVNDLLSMVGYRGVWADWDGAFRSGPYVTAAQRPDEWVFDVADPTFGIVGEDRKVTNDVWGVPNRWVFYTNGLSAQPVAGVSKYTVNNTTTGLSSQSSLGVVRPAQPQGVDAASYASLVTQGDAVVAAAIRSTETIVAAVSKFPLAWHFDVASYLDPALDGPRRVQGTSWSVALDTTDDMTMTFQTIGA